MVEGLTHIKICLSESLGSYSCHISDLSSH